MLQTFEWIWNFFLLAAGFGLVIFVHELGHFLAAKAVGIKVEQFAIGFGSAALSWRKGIGLRPGSTEREYQTRLERNPATTDVSETEYRFNWFPLGGYVKMLGQDDFDPSVASDDPRAFSSKPVWARMVVISAGVVMNLIFAVILFVIAYSFGVDVMAPVVGSVDQTTHAAFVLPQNEAVDEPGLQIGDRILTVNGDPVRSFADVQMAAALASSGRPVRLEVERDGEGLLFLIEPQPGFENLLQIGIGASAGNELLTPRSEKDRIAFDEALERAGVAGQGLEPGMHLTAVNDTPVDAYWQVQRIVNESRGEPVELTFAGDDESADRPSTTTVTLTPRPTPDVTGVTVGETSVPVEHVLGLSPPLQIENVAPLSGAAKAGLKPGDLIARLDDLAWPRFDQLIDRVQSRAGESVRIVVLRDEELLTFDVDVSRKGMIGITRGAGSDTNHIAQPLQTAVWTSGAERVEGATAAAALDLLPGSRILAVNGVEIEDWTDLQVALRDAIDPDASESTVELVVESPLVDAPVETIEWTIPCDQARALVNAGWTLPLNQSYFALLEHTLQAGNPVNAVRFGFYETKRMLVMTYLTLDRLIRGTIQIQNLKGPVGIAEIGTRVAYEKGFLYLLMFLAIINVNLAVINFLPIPVLDGGWMVLLAIEKLKGSPVSERTRNAATMVGFLFLAAIILITFYNDVTNLIRTFFLA